MIEVEIELFLVLSLIKQHSICNIQKALALKKKKKKKRQSIEREKKSRRFKVPCPNNTLSSLLHKQQSIGREKSRRFKVPCPINTPFSLLH